MINNFVLFQKLNTKNGNTLVSISLKMREKGIQNVNISSAVESLQLCN